MKRKFSLRKIIADNGGQVPFYAWPGGYQIIYTCKDGGCLCPACVEKELEQILEQEDAAQGAGAQSDGGAWDPQWAVDGFFTSAEFDESVMCDNCSTELVLDERDQQPA